jgi:hypothetical protein
MPELLRSLTDVSAAPAGDQHGGKRKRRGSRGAKNADRIRRIPTESDWRKDLSKRVVKLNVRPQTRLSRYTSDDRLFPKAPM